MKLLLDTQALLWFVWDDARLSEMAATGIQEPTAEKYVSVASLWEIAIKLNIGKLQLAEPLDEFLQKHVIDNGFQILPLTTEHVARYPTLPLHHRDPFDRILVAQCQVDGLDLISSDTAFEAYDIKRVWESSSTEEEDEECST